MGLAYTEPGNNAYSGFNEVCSSAVARLFRLSLLGSFLTLLYANIFRAQLSRSFSEKLLICPVGVI